MVDQEVIHKLRMLSGREREVLKLFCEGNNHETIGKILFIGKNTVKTHMGNIYIKLGLDHLPSSARRMIIYQTYCPAVHEFAEEQVKQKPVEPEPVKPEPVDAQPVNPEEVDPEPLKPEPEEPKPFVPEPVVPEPEPEPVPDEVIDMVNEDEHALMVVEPIKDDFENRDREEKGKKRLEEINVKKATRRKNGWKWIVLFIMLALMAFGGFKLYEWVNGFISNVQVPSAQESTKIAEFGQVTLQVQPSITTKSENPTAYPTNTVVFPTNIPVPTNIPKPKISLPFNDDFSKGFNSVWDLQFADWIITNGKASIIQAEHLDTGWAIINDPTLNNYRLKVHVNTPHMYTSAQGETYILIRYDQNRDKQLILKLTYPPSVFWGMTRGLQDYIDPITDAKKYDFPASSDVVIEANGNTFTAWVSGQMVGSISISGYEHGGLGLGIFCTFTDCPTLSNFSLEPIN